MVQANTKALTGAQPALFYAEAANGDFVRASGRGWFNVLDYGPGEFDAAVHIDQAAVDSITLGANVAQSLSLVYLNLTAAQTRYPRALALTETFDWHCHQAAIDAARANKGGVVYTPAGQYKMNGSSKLAPSALIFPLCSEVNTEPTITLGSGAADYTDPTARVQVNWIGDGPLASRLYWDADAGSVANDNFAVQFGDIQGLDGTSGGTTNSRYQSGANSSGFVRDIGLTGPNTTNTLEAKGCNMSGIQFAARRELHNVRIENFWAGVDVVGDHTTWTHIYIFSCFYGIYVNYRSSTMYGDFSIGDKLFITTCRKACIGVHAGGWMNNWKIWGRCFFGHSPYVFFKENTAGTTFPSLTPSGTGTVKGDWMSSCSIDMPMFEDIGNVVICDDNVRAAGTTQNLPQVHIHKSTLSFNNTYQIGSGHPRGYCSIGGCYGMDIDINLILSMSGVTPAFFNFANGISGGVTISGDIEGMFTTAASAGISLFGITEQQTNKIKLIHKYDNAGASGQWMGRLQHVYGAITKGDFMTSLTYGVQASSDTHTTQICVGVARAAASATGQKVPVAEWGTNIAVNTTGAVTGGQLWRIGSTAGKLQAATSITDGRVVGRSRGSAGIDLFGCGM